MERDLQCLVVSGPTASGKSGLALELAQKLGAEIINADSVQIYREFDIGSAKPTASELALCPHHLFSILDPLSRCDAFRFAELGREKIVEVLSRSSLPIISGGTGLYIKSLLSGLSELPLSEIEQEREGLTEKIRQEVSAGALKSELLEALHVELRSLDPEGALRIPPTDSYRLLRDLAALRVFGKPLRVLQLAAPKKAVPRALVLCLWPEREELYRNIDQRVEEMLRAGLVEEVRCLKEKYPAASALNSIGYAEVCEYLEGRIQQEQMSELIKQATRRYAKRQYTWWRHQPHKAGWELRELTASVKPLGTLSDSTDRLTCLVQSFMERKEGFEKDSIYLLRLK